MSNSAITGPIFTDVRRSPSGSAAAPSWSFADATGTGVYLASTDVLALSTAGVQRVVVDAAGNVGIGTASPITFGTYKILDIRGTSGGWLNMGTAGTSSFYMYTDGTNAAINTQTAGHLAFGTSNTERMRIDANGALTVGSAGTSITHTIQAPSNPAGTPAVYIRKQNVAINSSGNSYIEFYGASGGYDGYLGITGTTLQVVDSSDARKKENIRPANYGLKEIQALKPAVFDWKEEFGGEKNVKGFIAQEVKEVLPECVTIKDESEHGGLADSHFLGTATIIPVLVAAIQEQQEIIGKLEARLAALESK